MSNAKNLIVSVSGIRGIVGDSLTCHDALSFALALGTYLDGGTVVVGRDGRANGTALHHAILAGLLESGCDVHDVGIAPTPTVGIAVKRLKASGAIQITASHNPAQWNGLKLFGGDGRVLNASEGEKIKSLFESGELMRMSWDGVGALSKSNEALEWHGDRVLELIDVDLIRAARLKILLDANGGAGGELGRSLLEALGCELVCLGCEADGHFAHEPEPTEANLAEVCPKVCDSNASVGLALDPDSDRLALIDEKGRYVGEELTLALAARYRLAQQKGSIVINVSTSRVTEDVAKRFGVECHYSAVGEANVVDKMLAVGAVIGGEGNGGVIDPRVGLVRDPFIGIGLILSLMAETKQPLSELVDEMSAYHIVKNKHDVERDRLPSLLEELEREWPDARVNRADGLRLDWEDRWVHVRPSNTEPIVRVIAEAKDESHARALCEEVGRRLSRRS